MQYPRPPLFVRELAELSELLLRAKLMACPHCGRAGLLIGHGLLMGNAEHAGARVVRGRRLLCSNRARRPGCGRTCSVRLANVIKGFTVRTHALSRTWHAVAEGACLKVAWERARAGLCLRSGYRLWRRLLAAQPHVRTALSSLCPPPDSDDARPFVQLHQHLQRALSSTMGCLLAGLQLSAQRSLMG
jgi:hypothetical protein